MGLKEQIVEVAEGLSGTLGVTMKNLKTGLRS